MYIYISENDPNDKSKKKVADSDNEGEVEDDEDEMAEILGFSGFSSTKVTCKIKFRLLGVIRFL